MPVADSSSPSRTARAARTRDVALTDCEPQSPGPLASLRRVRNTGQSPSLLEHAGGLPPQCVVRDVSFRMGDQRAISALTMRAKLAGVLSCLAGIEPPRAARRFLTLGSSSALSSAAASFEITSLGAPLGAKMPAQMLI